MDNQPLINQQQIAVGGDASKAFFNSQEKDNDAKDWLGIFGVMMLTYAYVVVLFTISIQGVFASYQGWLGAIFGVFVLYVAGIAYAWYKGYAVAEQLSRQMVEDKLKLEEAAHE